MLRIGMVSIRSDVPGVSVLSGPERARQSHTYKENNHSCRGVTRQLAAQRTLRQRRPVNMASVAAGNAENEASVATAQWEAVASAAGDATSVPGERSARFVLIKFARLTIRMLAASSGIFRSAARSSHAARREHAPSTSVA